jgi:hypothetical protein
MLLESIAILNNNKIVWGVTMILLNMGSRYILADLGKIHETILTNEWFKKIVLFSMFFVATRDLTVSFLLSVIYILVVDGIFHEKRNFTVVKTVPNKKISEVEYKNAKATVLAYEDSLKSTPQEPSVSSTEVYDNYLNNIQLIKYR